MQLCLGATLKKGKSNDLKYSQSFGMAFLNFNLMCPKNFKSIFLPTGVDTRDTAQFAVHTATRTQWKCLKFMMKRGLEHFIKQINLFRATTGFEKKKWWHYFSPFLQFQKW